MSQKEAVREFKKGLIIDAALQLFQEHSYDEVTVQDIALATGIGKATLYQYFACKEEIVYTSMLRTIDETNFKIEQCCLRHDDPRQALENVIEQIYGLYLSQNRLFLAYLGLKLQNALKPEWLEEARIRRERKYEILSQMLDKGVEQGVFIQAEGRRLTRAFLNIIRGFSLESLEKPGRICDPVEKTDLELIRSIIFRGILVDGGGKTGE
ncbi:MAG TPA: TetR/AcrR family transcriptional regulator [Syntrophomonadaceae bacterium]|nr:TetR/AcrR family transcriptional regulator [Syntrophomonadaceae bacterium]